MSFGQTMSLDEFARSLAPHLNILSISHPVPVFRRHNLIVLADVPTAGIAALIGAILGGALGSVWTVFAGFGGSDAYRQSFVNDDITELTIASLHTDDISHMADAMAKLPPSNGVTVLQVDARGHLTDDIHAGRGHI